MINGNAAGATASVPSSLTAGAGTTTVTITKPAAMPFGASVGVPSRTLTATATVTWGQVPTAATTFPLGMSICDHQAWKTSPSSTLKLYRYDFYQSGRSDDGDNTAVKCGTKYSLKGGLWLIDGTAWIPNGGCKISTSIGITGWIAASNVFFPSSCAERARALEAGKTYMLPVYDTPAATKYTNRFLPTIRGYAPFVVTGWRIGGWFGFFGVESGGSVSSGCTVFNLCRGLQGYFSGSIVQLDEVDSYGINPLADFGSIRVKLLS